jgi:hypothetical protein
MSEIFIAYKPLRLSVGVPDLNRNPTKSTPLPHFMLRGRDEYWKDAVCVDHGLSSVEDLSWDCSALRWRLPSSHPPLCRAIPRLGICAADVPRELARLPDEPLREFGVDTPIAVLVGMGQGGASHRRANAHVIELGGLCRQAGLDVAQALAIGQLCKRQDAEVFGTGQRSHPVIAAIARDDASEGRPRKKVHQLREQGLAGVHRESSGKYSPDDPLKALSRSSRHHQILAKKDCDSCSYTTIQPS